MSSRPLKLLFLGGLAASVLFGNAPAMAQYDSSDDAVVVPTTGSTRTTTTPTGTSTTTRTRTSTPTGTSTTTSTSSSSQTVNTATRFSCQMDTNGYTVMYSPESQPNQLFAWATPQALGGGWDSQRRCATIAQRLETYRPDGLVELRTSTLNGYDVLCVTSEAQPDCRLVLTVPPGRDAFQVRNDVFQNLVSADSGQSTIGVNTYRGGGLEDAVNLGRTLLGNGKRAAVSKDAIQLKPFLDKKDGGSGNLLRNVKKTVPQSKPSQSGTRLNPNLFR
ncbi:COP23 domain-containing protein [Calothrix sp. CCY 0018]|uniref:COP23 domain-containing protein n=1 Tax=Calothrix sp. CCY 0018 TaxID=3103864 RepID=UPI0039C6F254